MDNNSIKFIKGANDNVEIDILEDQFIVTPSLRFIIKPILERFIKDPDLSFLSDEYLEYTVFLNGEREFFAGEENLKVNSFIIKSDFRYRKFKDFLIKNNNVFCEMTVSYYNSEINETSEIPENIFLALENYYLNFFKRLPPSHIFSSTLLDSILRTPNLKHITTFYDEKNMNFVSQYVLNKKIGDYFIIITFYVKVISDILDTIAFDRLSAVK